MPVDLNSSLSWKTANADAATMLDQLQPNIVKPHVRDHLVALFLEFENRPDGRAFLQALAGKMKSAKQHLQEIEAFKTSHTQGTPYLGVGLTAAGYVALGVPAAKVPPDPSFGAGMKARRAVLGDPASAAWDNHFRSTINAVVLVGDKAPTAAHALLAQVKALMPAGLGVVGEERGLAQHNVNGNGIEHFGYVDGRSQPLFLREDVAEELRRTDGATVWNPEFPLSQVIVRDLAAPDPQHHFGSYFVFRKLEQNVRRFKLREEKLAKDLGLEGDDAERAGAMIVGRFEDGTPVTLQSGEGTHHPVPNNFTYASDPDGMKCPFFGHIRKTNPRGSGGFEPPAAERRHLLARRGQTYGVRTDNPNDGDTESKPTGDVGLLFMAFNADIGAQFEFTQQSWANNASFPRTPSGAAPGVDPVMGQGARASLSCPVEWGGDPAMDSEVAPSFAQSVSMKGGEYFFMPSLAFLRSLAP